MIVLCETGFLLVWIHIPNCWTNAGRELLLHVTCNPNPAQRRLHNQVPRKLRSVQQRSKGNAGTSLKKRFQI